MLNNLIDRIGEYNPQLMRELKSRLSWRNLGITAFLSLLVQGMVLIGQYSKLPVPSQINTHQYANTEYCFYVSQIFPSGNVPPIPGSNCKLDAFNNVLINWPKWWGDAALGISAVMFMGLFAGGVYLLASSFSQEERRGTLDFIRLTPQRASSIISGKLLGVPILVYLGTALALPLQIHAVQAAQLARIGVLSWDLLMVSMGILLYLAAILTTMWFKAQSILLAGISLGLSYPLIYMSLLWYGKGKHEGIAWYGMHLGNQVCAYLLYTGMATLSIYWLYQAIQRRYLKPTATVLSKAQSYVWSGMYHLVLLGFAFYRDGEKSQVGFHLPFGLGNHDSFVTMIISTFFFGWLILLIPLLLPSQQSLVEWSRHRSVTAGKGRSLIADLIGYEKSPAMLAVVINMAIATVIWLPFSVWHIISRSRLPEMNYSNDFSYGNPLSKLLVGIGITIVLAVIYSAIAHWCLFWKVNQRHAWTAGIIGGLVFLPVVLGSLIAASTHHGNNPAFLFSPFLWISVRQVPGFMSMGVLLALCGAMIWLNLRLWRVLKRIGRSESFQHLATA
jgi:ABC-type transport system involved in cytochrome c biogenesis permease component